MVSILFFNFFTSIGSSSEPPIVDWQRTYGGTTYTSAHQVIQTGDGGYAIAGLRASDSIGAGGNDFWLVKIHENGTREWNKIYGLGGNESAFSLIQNDDGGYIIVGYSSSFRDWDDVLVVRTDSKGDLLWYNSYGWPNQDRGYAVIGTMDGGFAIAGISTMLSLDNEDFFLIKVNASGTMEWNRTFGGQGFELANALIETTDGGFLLAGSTTSWGLGERDFWLVKTDQNGAMEWNRTYGGPEDEVANSVVQTSDGGYAIAGMIESYNADDGDYWLVKTDENGSMIWNRTLGGKEEDIATDLIQTDDGGFVLGGFSHQLIFRDVLLVKTNSEGYIQWYHNYSGQGDVYATSLVQTVDDGFVIAGYRDLFNHRNFFVLKTNSSSQVEGNLHPLADAGKDINVSINQNVTFSTAESFDPDGNIVRFRWDYDGNGEFDWTSNTSETTTITYNVPGIYHAVLDVTDDNGTIDTGIRTLQVIPEHESLVSRSIPGEIWIGTVLLVILISIYITLRLFAKKQLDNIMHLRSMRYFQALTKINIWYHYLFFSFFAIIGIKFTLSFFLSTPTIYFDEHAYGYIAGQIAHGNLGFVHETPFAASYPSGYSYFLAPAYFLGDDMDLAYRCMLFINCVLSTAVLFPVFLIMKQFVTQKQSLLTALLVAFLPTILIHNYLLMSENAFNLIFLFVILLVICTFSYEKIDRTFIIYSVLLGLSIGLLILIKAIGIAIFTGVLCFFIFRLIKNLKLSFLKYGLFFLPFLPFIAYALLNPSFLERYQISIYFEYLAYIFSDPSSMIQYLSIFLNEINYFVIMSYFIFMVFAIFLFIHWYQIPNNNKDRLWIFTVFTLVSMFFLLAITALHVIQGNHTIYARYVSAGLPVFIMLGVIGMNLYPMVKNPRKGSHISILFIILGIFFIFFFPVEEYMIENNLDLVWIKLTHDVQFLGIDGFTFFRTILGIFILLVFIIFMIQYIKKKDLQLFKGTSKLLSRSLILAVIISIVLFLPSFDILLSEDRYVMSAGHNAPARWLMENNPGALIYVDDSISTYHGAGMHYVDWHFMYTNLYFWLNSNNFQIISRNELRDMVLSGDVDAEYILSTHDLTEYYVAEETIYMNIPLAPLKKGSYVIWRYYNVSG